MSHLVSKLTFLIPIPAAFFLGIACSATGGSGPGGNGSGDGTGGGSDTIDIGSGGSMGDGDITVDPNQNLPPTLNCADGMLDDDEVCDDGNKVDGDGCYANCRGIEQGFLCPKAGEPCIPFAVCGDGVAAFPEQCDDGNSNPGDGCSDNCKIEIGFKCPMQNAPCSPTTCGDGIVEGAEMCEPSLVEGCTAQCQFAPDCSGGACTSSCGDGLVLGEACDDGNTLNGDGCSETCQPEEGYTCENESTSGECEKSPSTGECILRIPVTYRDFADAHVAFGTSCANTAPLGQVKTGMVQTTLNAEGNPVPTGDQDCSSTMGEWYTDSDKSATFNSEIVLYQSTDGSYVNRWGENGEQFFWTVGWSNEHMKTCSNADPCGPYDGTPFFYPIDAMPNPMDTVRVAAEIYDGDNNTYGGGGQGTQSEATLTGVSTMHNYGFTSEIAYWFAFDADTNATLEFAGDDDVWVFVNNQLALDLGGKHSAADGSVALNGASPTFGMTPGNVYEIKIFHAERQPTGSTFKLTLAGFDTSRSDCRPTCGDGIVAFGEQCDDGVNDGGYNECQQGCVLGGYCGDGLVQEGEVCDDNAPDAPSGCIGCRIPVVR